MSVTMEAPVKLFATMILLASVAGGGVAATAMQQAVAPPAAQPQPMTFFVTSEPIGDGGNLGGLAGADAQCLKLGTAVGRGAVAWHAYLSTQGPGAVNARDRIGQGPWYNQKGIQIAANVGQLHGDTLEEARRGIMLGKATGLTEKGQVIEGFGDRPNRHDILTGSTLDGRAFPPGEDRTCQNWTSDAEGVGAAQLGHVDKVGGGNGSWNSSHPSRGCSQPDMVRTGGVGLLYCFAPAN